MCYVTQMGGDFVVSKNGKLVLVHCSQSSTDRPSVDTLLQAVRTAQLPTVCIIAVSVDTLLQAVRTAQLPRVSLQSVWTLCCRLCRQLSYPGCVSLQSADSLTTQGVYHCSLQTATQGVYHCSPCRHIATSTGYHHRLCKQQSYPGCVLLQFVQIFHPGCVTAGHTDRFATQGVSHCRPNKQICYPACVVTAQPQQWCPASGHADSWANGGGGVGGGGDRIVTGNLACVLTYFFDSLFDLPRVYSVVKETLVYSQLYSSHILILSNTNSSC